MNRISIPIIFILIFTQACASLNESVELPVTQGEQHSSSSYIPFDPLPVFSARGIACAKDNSNSFKHLLDSLPDQTVRIAVAEYDSSGTLVFGPVKVGGEGKSYQVVLDYVSVDTANVPVYVYRFRTDQAGKKIPIGIFEDVPFKTQYRVKLDPSSDAFYYYNEKGKTKNPDDSPRTRWDDVTTENSAKSGPEILEGDRVIIPVYVGLGLRLTATITVTKGSANLSSLGSLAAGAEAGKLVGSLVVQTLGISGKSVSTSLPLPSELNQTTIQGAILALGSIKAVIHDRKNTIVTPRVVGIYNPIGGGRQLVNGVISILANDPIKWKRPCKT